MKHGLEICIFGIIAIALHVLVFVQAPQSGVQAGGSGGDALVSIQAAAPTVVEVVKSWERSPTVTPDVQNELVSPEAVPPEVPTVPQIEFPPAPHAEMHMAITQPDSFRDVDITPPPPPAPPEPVAEAASDTRPKPRPAQQQAEEGVKAKQASAGRQKEVAAGSGGSSQAGLGNAEVTTGDPDKMAKLQAVWGAKIRARIERNKRYPRGARANGNVTIELRVSRDGKLVSYRLKRSSGSAELDDAAMGAVARAKRFPKAPKGLSGNNYTFAVAIKLQK